MSSCSSSPVCHGCVPYPQCTALIPRQPWFNQLENNKEFIECENRPWANEQTREKTGCIGNDFVLHQPRVLFRFFWSSSLSQLQGIVHWNKDTEGPPKGSHGASVATVFDEILAYPVWRSGLTAFTANLNLNLRKMIPFMATLKFTAYIKEKVGKKIYVYGEIHDPYDLSVYADCTGLWIENTYLAKIGDARAQVELQTQNGQVKAKL